MQTSSEGLTVLLIHTQLWASTQDSGCDSSSVRSGSQKANPET